MVDVLLVDDEDDIRESVADLLRASGFSVVTGRDGREALAVLHAGERPCLILLDLVMPVIDGYQFRSAQRREDAIASIPVVLLSSSPTVRRDAEAMGTECLEKPIVGRLLVDLVERLVRG